MSAKPQMPRGASRQDQFRLRVRYCKDGRLAYLGHLEVINTINRCVRRSGLPFAVGSGFAQRIRLQFSQALPVGASSAGEYYDLLLTQKIDAEKALSALSAATPVHLGPQEVAYVSHELAALEAWLTRATWRVDFLQDTDDAVLQTGIESLRAKKTLEYLRGEKRKSIDLEETLVSYELVDGGLLLSTRSTNAGSLRPQILVAAACREVGIAQPPALRVQRTAQWHEENGCLVEAIPPAH